MRNKRSLIFLNPKVYKPKEYNKTIGLIGTHSGVGVTYTGLMLSMHLSQVMGKKTAYLEMSGKDDFYFIQKERIKIVENEEEKKQFHIGKLHFFRQVKEETIGSILNMSYDFVVIDFGNQFRKYKNELLRCDLKLVLCSFNLWKKQYLYSFLEQCQEIEGVFQWKYLSVLGQKSDGRILKREKKVQIKAIPYVPDPFFLTKEIEEIFDMLI